MGQNTLSDREMQAQRLKIKQIGQQMQNLATEGAGLSPWEAGELVRLIEEVYFADPDLKQIQPGQMKYSCVSVGEPACKPIKDCQMVTVTLTLFHDEDGNGLPHKDKDASIETRRRRLLRICDEAREQGWLLSQEDLSKLLMCDIRTIRRNIAELKTIGITVPTRGTVKDIGPALPIRKSLFVSGSKERSRPRLPKRSITA